MEMVAYSLGKLLGVVLLVSPWFFFRRWGWGRVLVISAHVFIAFITLVALIDPYFPPEARSPVTLLALPTILVLASRDRNQRSGPEPAP